MSRRADRAIGRTTYAELGGRVVRLASALRALGVRPGDRVATLAWNTARHLEAYFAVPLSGAVLHTVNPRLSPADIAHIVEHADDQVMFHVNAWGLPFAAALVGAKQVHPGPHVDPVSLLDLIERERFTLAAGVPTVWLGVLQALDRERGEPPAFKREWRDRSPP